MTNMIDSDIYDNPGGNENGNDIEPEPEPVNEIELYRNQIVMIEDIPENSGQRDERREFFRMLLSVDVYYKIIDIEKAGVDSQKLRDLNKLKFDSEKAKEIKKIADEGILEKDMGYLKLATRDLSAGGFKYHCALDINIAVGDFLDCLVIINDEALPAIAQILSLSPDYEYPELYDVRALVHEISDPARDRVVRYIFAQERRIDSVFFKIRN